jgi:hypothetical protein
MNNSPEGVQIQTVAEHVQEDARIARLTLRVWPLPIELLGGLQVALEKAAGEYLVAAGLVSGECVDLTTRGTLQ